MRLKPLLRQLLIGMSMRRYLPATGTAGLLRSIVSGNSRVPRPPPRMRLRTSLMLLVYCFACGIANKNRGAEATRVLVRQNAAKPTGGGPWAYRLLRKYVATR